MSLHLEQISKATEPTRHAVFIIDGEDWHVLDIAKPFDNLKLIKLTSHSPELNPVEQVWSWLRQHHLPNRVFADYEEIVALVSQAWNQFVSVPERVKRCVSEVV